MIGLLLEPGATSLTIVVIELATGMEVRYDAPRDVFLGDLRWQPGSAAVPWPVWTPPGPGATPAVGAGSLELAVHGAFEASTTLPAECESRDAGIAISAGTPEIGAQLGVSDDGTANFLSVNGPGFAAFAGKGFAVEPPFVITESGSTLAAGSISFHDIPSIDAPGVISGTLAWACAAV